MKARIGATLPTTSAIYCSQAGGVTTTLSGSEHSLGNAVRENQPKTPVTLGTVPFGMAVVEEQYHETNREWVIELF